VFDDILKVLAKFYVFWLMADFIILAFSILVCFLSGGLESALTEAFTNLALGIIPFPFSLLIQWAVNPILVIIQLMITLFLFLIKEKA